MNTVDVLVKARALIEKPENWGKGLASRRPGTRCVEQAAIDAAPDLSLSLQALESLDSVIGHTTSDWNDEPERTHAEVLNAFDRAIEAERAKTATDA